MVDVGQLAGTMIGNYRLEKQLGAGGFGAVYLAQPMVDGHHMGEAVALKVLRPAAPDRQQQLLRELKLAATLRHPHLIQVIGHPGEHVVRDAGGLESRVYYFAMELADESLGARLKRGALSQDEAIDVIRAVASALDYLHRQKLVHRDVKPDNILRVGNTWKLGDLGLTRTEVDSTYLVTWGTLNYLSPESLNKANPKAWWDIWALAAR